MSTPLSRVLETEKCNHQGGDRYWCLACQPSRFLYAAGAAMGCSTEALPAEEAEHHCLHSQHLERKLASANARCKALEERVLELSQELVRLGGIP